MSSSSLVAPRVRSAVSEANVNSMRERLKKVRRSTLSSARVPDIRCPMGDSRRMGRATSFESRCTCENSGVTYMMR